MNIINDYVNGNYGFKRTDIAELVQVNTEKSNVVWDKTSDELDSDTRIVIVFIIRGMRWISLTEMTYSKGIYDGSRVETVVVVDRFDVVRIMFSHCFAFI